MEYMPEKDIIVDVQEWHNILSQLKEKDMAVKTMLDEFIKALDILVNDGFKQGNRHDNMKAFRDEIAKLKDQISGIYESVEKTVNDLNTRTENDDKYKGLFNLL